VRIILVIVGALLGAVLASGSTWLYGAILGAMAALVLVELGTARQRIDALEKQLAALRKASLGRSAEEKPQQARGEPEPATATRDVPQSRFEPAPPPMPGEEVPSATPGTVGTEVPSTTPGGVVPSPASREQASQASFRMAPDAASGGWAPRGSAAAAAGSGRHSPPPPEAPLVRAVREWFTGGNTLVRGGIIILFIGVAFLLRYVAEHTHVPIELRLSGVALGGIVLLVLGWRLRTKRPGYALALQGGAIGILYLTVFASLRLFSVLTPGPAFAVLVLLSAFSAALAVLQNSQALAMLAVGCGFLAPVLASSGQGNHVVLFSYYGVLNLAILAIAWFKAWRPLNVVGFLFTFLIGTAWGVLRYEPRLFASTEPFLMAFFVLYVVIAVLFSLRQRPVLNGYVDGTLVFGVPVVAFALQSALVHDRPFAMAHSALAASGLYLVVAWLLHRGKRETQRLLVEAFMALGVAFLTLAVPLALDGRWSAATWALEGAALVWVGCRQGRRVPRAFGALLQLAGGVIFLADIGAEHSAVPLLNSAYLGGVMIAFASVFSARVFIRNQEALHAYERPFAPLLFFWALLWWLISGTTEIARHVPDPYEPMSILAFLAFTALVCSEVRRRLEIGVARLPALALLPAMLAFAVLAARAVEHPFAEGGWLAWPIAFGVFYLVCRRHEGEGRIESRLLHAVSAWLLVALLSWELAWVVDQGVDGSGSWPAIAWALVPAVALFGLPRLAKRLPWPVGAHEETYLAIAGSGLALALATWTFMAFGLRGDPFPLPYVPLLNPLDLTHALVLLVLVRYWLHVHKARYASLADVSPVGIAAVLAGLTFLWLNAALLRTLHYWAGVPFELYAMLVSQLVQTSLSIFWTVLALAMMLFATRRGSRVVWITGASLLGVVVAKLFLIDLSSIGTVARIVSFVGVGLLMLVVGYFSPLPPARKEATS